MLPRGDNSIRQKRHVLFLAACRDITMCAEGSSVTCSAIGSVVYLDRETTKIEKHVIATHANHTIMTA